MCKVWSDNKDDVSKDSKTVSSFCDKIVVPASTLNGIAGHCKTPDGVFALIDIAFHFAGTRIKLCSDLQHMFTVYFGDLHVRYGRSLSSTLIRNRIQFDLLLSNLQLFDTSEVCIYFAFYFSQLLLEVIAIL